MTPVEALEMALEKEREAKEMYSRFAALHPAAKEMFIFLSAEEARHEHLVSQKITELRMG